VAGRASLRGFSVDRIGGRTTSMFSLLSVVTRPLRHSASSCDRRVTLGTLVRAVRHRSPLHLGRLTQDAPLDHANEHTRRRGGVQVEHELDHRCVDLARLPHRSDDHSVVLVRGPARQFKSGEKGRGQMAPRLPGDRRGPARRRSFAAADPRIRLGAGRSLGDLCPRDGRRAPALVAAMGLAGLSLLALFGLAPRADRSSAPGTAAAVPSFIGRSGGPEDGPEASS
jgi:hypothetical protein